MSGGTPRNLLQQIYRLRLALSGVIFLAAGIIMFIVSHSDKLDSIALAIGGIGTVSLIFEYASRQVIDIKQRDTVREEIAAQIPAIRDAVLSGFAVSPDVLLSHGRELHHDTRVSIALSPAGTRTEGKTLYIAVVRWSHRTTAPLVLQSDFVMSLVGCLKTGAATS
ncbi:hypothetical protein OG943_15510 [Amycolatopsis sp. NBC_00345]|uniref:hypothetical protein n=1 Tax=Amycolatopsis sp. NBC_00345 TaxID=2975955 RepID=UPI002E266901